MIADIISSTLRLRGAGQAGAAKTAAARVAPAVSAMSTLASGAPFEIKNVVGNAVKSGYECGPVDNLCRRAISHSMTHHLIDAQQRTEKDLYNDIGQQFVKMLRDKGGFVAAYQAEIEYIKAIGHPAIESRIEELSTAVNRFCTLIQSGGAPSYEEKHRIANEARVTASVMRILGQDDELIVRMISQNDTLSKHGVDRMAANLIDSDKRLIMQGKPSAAAASPKASQRSGFAGGLKTLSI